MRYHPIPLSHFPLIPLSQFTFHPQLDRIQDKTNLVLIIFSLRTIHNFHVSSFLFKVLLLHLIISKFSNFKFICSRFHQFSEILVYSILRVPGVINSLGSWFHHSGIMVSSLLRVFGSTSFPGSRFHQFSGIQVPLVLPVSGSTSSLGSKFH